MATLLFASELPGGPTRVAALKPIIQRALSDGHRVILAMRDLTSVRRHLCELQALVMLAPHVAEAEHPTPNARSLVELLAPACADPQALAETLRAWRRLYQEFSPDVIVCCDSPIALLAAHHTSFKKVILSDGFRCPPTQTPLPAFSGDLGSDQTARDEGDLVAKLNRAFECDGLQSVACFADLISGSANQVLTTLPELYPYGADRAPESMATPLDVDGCAPRWPRVKGMRVFASLEVGPSLLLLLDMMGRLGCPTVAAVLECPPELMKFARPSLHIAPDPVAWGTAAEQCDAAILHGDAIEVTHFLLAGVPLFLIPLTGEQRRTAERVAELGAGRYADVGSPMELARGWVEFRKGCGGYRAGAQRVAEGQRELMSGAAARGLEISGLTWTV